MSRLIEPHFRWLVERGFEVVEATDGGIIEATYRKGAVVVRATYETLDEWVDVTIARSRAEDLREEPYWARVRLEELLEVRRSEGTNWREAPRGVAGLDGADFAFGKAATLLAVVADDLLEGSNLDVLDEIIAGRRRQGVPGLDFPTTDRWVASREGFWFTTDSELPRDMATYMELSRSDDPNDRAVAALKIVIASRGPTTQIELDSGFARLVELLEDTDPDVRRASASALGEWGEPEVIEPILALLETEAGDRSSPMAAAATFLAMEGSKAQRAEVREALAQFAARGPAASAQVRELAWRIDRSRTVGRSG